MGQSKASRPTHRLPRLFATATWLPPGPLADEMDGTTSGRTSSPRPKTAPNLTSTDTRSHLGRVIRGGALSMGGGIIYAVAGFLLVVLITSSYDKATAGVLFSATSLFMVALSLVTLGTDVGLGRFVLLFAAESRNDAIRSCIRTAITVVVALSVVTAAVLLAVSPQLADLMGIGDLQGSTVIKIL